MERIEYAGGSFLTGSEISAALLAYAAALARRGGSVSLEVPARDDAGDPTVAHVLVGPASQFVSLPEADSGKELTDDEFVEHVQAAIRHLGPGSANAVSNHDPFPPEDVSDP
jgi:hypothetical protein